MRVPRADALPESNREFANWQDTGCEVAPHCLACPLPQCRYDRPGGARAIRNDVRDQAIREAYALTTGTPGERVSALTEQFGLSRRTVFRILALKLKAPA